MELYYVNSKNEKIDFMRLPYLARDVSELLDYDWDYDTDEKVIRGFSRGVCEIPLTVNVVTDSHEEYVQACGRLYEIAEYDILNNARGRLWCNDRYVPCNLISSKKTDWRMDVDFHMAYLRAVTDYPFWCRERPFSFRAGADVPEGFLDYPYDHAYDYAPPSNMRFLHNDHYYDCDFKCTVYGPCEDPRFMINDHVYEVRALLYDHEYLTFDSRDKSLVKTDYQGRRSNIFNSRNKEHDLFCKIPPGRSSITWNLGFDFDIILFQERSEPRW